MSALADLATVAAFFAGATIVAAVLYALPPVRALLEVLFMDAGDGRE